MHLGLKQLNAFYRDSRDSDHLVVATVIATEGSTYRKAGAMMLIDPGGRYAGLISGGCLEGDLVERTREVFADGSPRRVDYDLHDDETLVWGLGLGCGGDIHLFLQRLDRADGFGFLAPLFAAVERRDACLLGLVTEAVPDGLAEGTACLLTKSGAVWGEARLEPLLRQAIADDAETPRGSLLRFAAGGARQGVLLIRVEPPPLVLLCGAGPDSVPLARQVAGLGWDCTVVDHRPAFASQARFPGGVMVRTGRPAELAEQVELAEVSAAVVMSHHLEHDAAYLKVLAAQPPAYLALLGPAGRRHRLEERLGLPAGLVRGPAGLDIGGELPEAIALSIMAEIHAVLNKATGGRPLGNA